MKNLRLLTALWAIVFPCLFFSCDEEDTEAQHTSDLVGVWSHDAAEFDVTIDGEDIATYLTGFLGISEADVEEFVDQYTEIYATQLLDFNFGTWEFAADGTFSQVYDGGQNAGTWSISSDQSQLTMTANEETAVATVQTLTESQLVLHASNSVEQDLNQDGQTNTLEVSLVLTMVR